MKFIVTRTHISSSKNIQPCEGAILESYNPDTEKYVWSIEIASLEELVRMAELSVGNDVVRGGLVIESVTNREFPDIPQIEIYDDYRE